MKAGLHIQTLSLIYRYIDRYIGSLGDIGENDSLLKSPLAKWQDTLCSVSSQGEGPLWRQRRAAR